jgi:hypothetical protein
MHSAPAVSYPVGRSFMRSTCLWLPLLAGGAVVLLWTGQTDHPGLPHGLAMLAWLACAVVAGIEHRRPHAGQLRWDGQQWTWEVTGGEPSGEARVRLDWQRGMLLEFRAPERRRAWLWAERRRAPQHWDELRRALYSATPQPGGTPGPAGVHR